MLVTDIPVNCIVGCGTIKTGNVITATCEVN